MVPKIVFDDFDFTVLQLFVLEMKTKTVAMHVEPRFKIADFESFPKNIHDQLFKNRDLLAVRLIIK